MNSWERLAGYVLALAGFGPQVALMPRDLATAQRHAWQTFSAPRRIDRVDVSP
jgi:hypothetical protein